MTDYLKKWIISDDTYIVGDPKNKTITIKAGDSAIEINGQDGEIVLSGAINKMTGGQESDEILMMEQPLLTRIIPSTVMTPTPGALFRIPFNKIAGMVGDMATLAVLMG